LPQNQWVQYRVGLGALDTSQSPRLESITVGYIAPSSFNFSLSINPQNAEVMLGGAIATPPTITASETFGTVPNPVTFSVDPALLPPGIAYPPIFSNSPCTPSAGSCATQVDFGIMNAAAGVYVIPIKASVNDPQGGTVTKEVTFQIKVTEPFDFSLSSPTPPSLTIMQGASDTLTFNITKIAGEQWGVVEYLPLAFTGAPIPGVSVSYNPVQSTGNGTVIATITTTFTGGAGSTPTGTYNNQLIITARTASAPIQTHPFTFSLTVTPGFNFNFSINNSSGGAYPGNQASSPPTLTTSYAGGPAGVVTYSVSQFSGITITPGPIPPCPLASGSPSCIQPLTISADAGAGEGPYYIQITATANSVVITRAYTLTVYGPFDFTLAFADAAPCAGGGATCSVTIAQDQQPPLALLVNTNFSAPEAMDVTFTSPVSVNPPNPNVSIFPPSPCQGAAGAQTFCNGLLSISAGGGAEGLFVVTLTGREATTGVTHNVTMNLTVTVPPVDYNMRGWAWSDTIGWISFNSQNCDTDFDQIMDNDDFLDTGSHDPAPPQCPPLGTIMPNYGAHLNLSTYELSGYAWNENVGWITFEKTIAGTPPGTPYNGPESYMAKLDTVTGDFKGWARAVSCPDSACDTDSEWGWIKLSGIAMNNETYEVGNSVNELIGWAWGGSVLGWISMHAQNCDEDGFLAAACGGSGGIPFSAHNAGTHPGEYKVWVKGTLPNAAPKAENLESNFLNRCANPFEPKFTFRYTDAEGDPLVQYTITIYDSMDTIVDTVSVSYCDTNNNQFTDTGSSCGGRDDATTLIPSGAITTASQQPDPERAPAYVTVEPIYGGSALQYGTTYYFTVEVRDPAHVY
ncbi:MAG: hypothetical protein AAB581_02725, partial [Patescibacteria group bacterium]